MNRIELIQKIIARANFNTYLEIGCQTGFSFLPVKAKRKMAVDPNFLIPRNEKLKWILKQPSNLKNKYFEETSDDFFSNQKGYLRKLNGLDVVLVDGMHTFINSLKDVLNSLKYLNDNGIIVMHDCYPPHEAAALPTESFPTQEEQNAAEGWTGEWCGDVWKTIVYLKENYGDKLDLHVLNTDFGIGIVRPKVKTSDLDLSLNEDLFRKVDGLTYYAMMQDASSVINLKDESYANEVISKF